MSVISPWQAKPRAPRQRPTRRHRHHSFGFWITALAFLMNMGFSAVPTPLYVLYQRRDHFSTIMITVVFAVYSVGVVASLFFAGHVSDWIGRKRVLVPALLLNIGSALIYMFAPSLTGLLTARIVSGVSVGLTTATATAYLSELHLGTWRGRTGSLRRSQIVSTAANLGGIGLGPLVAGLLAQYAPHPLVVPYLVFLIALAVLTVLVVLSPETADLPDPVPQYRPQRIAVPERSRRMFFAAVTTVLASFAVYGIFTSLVPSFLAGTLHETSHAVAGAVVFAAFASGAVAQVALIRVGLASTLRTVPFVLLPGLSLLVSGIWLPSLTVFVIGGVLTGAGAGLSFRSALIAAGEAAPAESRAEVLAFTFLGAYVGLTVPVVGLGIATQYVSARVVMLVFVVVVGAAVTLGTQMVRASYARDELGADSG